MSSYTDKNIPIKCAEDDVEVEGVESMVSHILVDHPTYTPKEAIDFARSWADAVYENYEQELANYYKDHEYERGLNRLRGKP